jgi:hypothetical protein
VPKWIASSGKEMAVDLGDYLLRLASGDGYIVLDGEGKCRLKNRDGSEVVFDDGHGRKYSPDVPRPFFNFYCREGLIRQDRSACAERGLVFRLTKNGKERATL